MTRTKTVLTALAGLAGSLCYSQQVSVSVTLDGDGKNLEFGEKQTFTCTWNSDDKLSNTGINLADEKLSIKWYYKGDTVYTMQADDYIPYPNFGSEFEGRAVSAGVSVNISQSTLTIDGVKLEDFGDYTCRVSLKEPKSVDGKMGYVSGNAEMSGVKIYKTPTVSLEEVTTEFDTRDQQYEEFLASIQPEETNTTENVDGSIAIELNNSSENTIPVNQDDTEDDTESSAVISDSRKRRQTSAEETASPEIEPVKSQVPLAKCVVKGAYPEPASIKIAIGETEISSLGDSEIVISNADELFDASVAVNAAIVGAEQNGKTIKCVVSDSENLYSADAESEALNIKYLPTEVSVVASSSEVFEGDSLNIKCQSNGNPAPVLSLVHLTDDSVNQAINGSSEYTISSVLSKENGGDYNFNCVAKSTEEIYSQWVKKSAPLAIDVNYLSQPWITINNVKNQAEKVDIVKVGESFTLECDAKASPEAVYKWFKITEGDIDDALESQDNAYKVDIAGWGHSGKYYCIANNGRGDKKSKIAEIDVQGDCKVKSIAVTAGKVDKNGKQSVTLDCVIDTAVQPACKIDWIYDRSKFSGKQSDSKLTINNVNEVGSSDLFESTFSCKASNGFNSNGDARVLKGTKIGEKLSAESGGIPWMWIGIGALVLVIAVVVFNKRKNSNEAPEEESQKMNA